MGIKIGIKTILDCNFGNRLQNYAIQEMLTTIGYDVDTLLDLSETCAIQKGKNVLKKMLNINGYKNKMKEGTNPYSKERGKVMEKWNQKNIHYSTIKFTRYHVPRKLAVEYDYFLAGSDQVWNPYFRKDTLMLLSFAPGEKRIGYSASFGVSVMPDEYKAKYSEELSKFKAISVRESSGVDIVNDLTEKKAEWLVDPTMMLTIDEWKKKEEKPPWLDDIDYIAVYSLGGLPQNVKTYIDDLAMRKGYKVYEILKKDSKDLYLISPFEFIYLIGHSKLMVTDSFHGTVFSILNKVPFLIFNRSDFHESMSSRFASLLGLFNMEKRNFSEGILEKDLLNCDFSQSDAILERERKKAIKFLLENMPREENIDC